MTTVHLVLPHDIDDRRRPSGGNRYDRSVADGLNRGGWDVREYVATSTTRLAAVLAGIPDAALVLVDGLAAGRSAEVVARHGHRLRIVVLVHAPLEDPVEGQALRAATAVVATSRWTGEQLVLRYGLDPAAVTVVTPGVEAAPMTPMTPAGTRLLCVGALTPVKGHDVLLDALDRLADRTWRCDVVGSPGVDPGWSASLRSHPSAGRLRWRGPLSGDRLDRAFGLADLVVLPSRRETYGMVLTEALARGIPVVASDVGGVSEI